MKHFLNPFRYIIIGIFFAVSFLNAAPPDISNLRNCIDDIMWAWIKRCPKMPKFEPYIQNYAQLIADLQNSTSHLPHVYQQVAAIPLIQFLQNLGEERYAQIFHSEDPTEEQEILQDLLPDVVLAILAYEANASRRIHAFEEISSEVYNNFLNDAHWLNKQTDLFPHSPAYGSIPPLIKFGDPDESAYIWTNSITSDLLGLGCGIMSLPSLQLHGGIMELATLAHEAGHDVVYADEDLLDELTQKVKNALLEQFASKELADYWEYCLDESFADICEYLHLGPSPGISLIGRLRVLEHGEKLRSIGYTEDPHPIDLLRAYLAAAAVKRLHFKDALAWSETITGEIQKDNAPLQLIDEDDALLTFPVSFETAIASADTVAQVIMQSKLDALQQQALQELKDWTDEDQAIVDQLTLVLQQEGHFPAHLGSGYAAYIVAAATQASLQRHAKIRAIFNEILNVLTTIHLQNPIWSNTATEESVAFLEHRSRKGRDDF